MGKAPHKAPYSSPAAPKVIGSAAAAMENFDDDGSDLYDYGSGTG